MKISFFHTSPRLIEVFVSQSKARPTFYWFSNYFHTLYDPEGITDYFYLFVKNPKDDHLELRAREILLDFDALYRQYLEYQSKLLSQSAGEYI